MLMDNRRFDWTAWQGIGQLVELALSKAGKKPDPFPHVMQEETMKAMESIRATIPVTAFVLGAFRQLEEVSCKESAPFAAWWVQRGGIWHENASDPPGKPRPVEALRLESDSTFFDWTVWQGLGQVVEQAFPLQSFVSHQTQFVHKVFRRAARMAGQRLECVNAGPEHRVFASLHHLHMMAELATLGFLQWTRHMSTKTYSGGVPEAPGPIRPLPAKDLRWRGLGEIVREALEGRGPDHIPDRGEVRLQAWRRQLKVGDTAWCAGDLPNQARSLVVEEIKAVRSGKVKVLYRGPLGGKRQVDLDHLYPNSGDVFAAHPRKQYRRHQRLIDRHYSRTGSVQTLTDAGLLDLVASFCQRHGIIEGRPEWPKLDTASQVHGQLALDAVAQGRTAEVVTGYVGQPVRTHNWVVIDGVSIDLAADRFARPVPYAFYIDLEYKVLDTYTVTTMPQAFRPNSDSGNTRTNQD